MPSRKPILRRSPRLNPLRRSPRLATATAPITQVPPSIPAPSPAHVMYEKHPRKRQKTQYEPQPICSSCSSSSIDNMTEEEFNSFNDALSDEDKEIQANLLMLCIRDSIPYTLDLFHTYRRNLEEVSAKGLL